jgi:hypothetical protein
MSSGMSVLVEGSAKTVVSVYGDGFDLVGFNGLGPGLHRRRGGK